MRKRTQKTVSTRSGRLEPLTLHPLSVDEALAGSMEVTLPDEAKNPPKQKPKAKKKRKKGEEAEAARLIERYTDTLPPGIGKV